MCAKSRCSKRIGINLVFAVNNQTSEMEQKLLRNCEPLTRLQSLYLAILFVNTMRSAERMSYKSSTFSCAQSLIALFFIITHQILV